MKKISPSLRRVLNVLLNSQRLTLCSLFCITHLSDAKLELTSPRTSLTCAAVIKHPNKSNFSEGCHWLRAPHTSRGQGEMNVCASSFLHFMQPGKWSCPLLLVGLQTSAHLIRIGPQRSGQNTDLIKTVAHGVPKYYLLSVSWTCHQPSPSPGTHKE